MRAMGTIFGALLALFAVWLVVIARGTPDDPEEWGALMGWGVFVQFVVWAVLLFTFLSVMDAAP